MKWAMCLDCKYVGAIVMSKREIETTIEQKLKEMNKVEPPALQRVYWIIASLAGMITALSLLLSFIDALRFEYLQVILISMDVGLLITVVLLGLKKGTINWSKSLIQAFKMKCDVDSLIFGFRHSFKNIPMKKEDSTLVRDTIIAVNNYVNAVRIDYRLALVENRHDLASDFQKEIEEYREVIKEFSELPENL